MKKRSISPGKWILYLILAIQAAVTTYPLIWMIVSSLKDNVSFFADPWSIPKNSPSWSPVFRLRGADFWLECFLQA